MRLIADKPFAYPVGLATDGTELVDYLINAHLLFCGILVINKSL